MNDDNIYEYDTSDGALLDTINIPIYNGSTVPVLTSIAHDHSGSHMIWMIDKGTVTYQSFVGYNVDTGAITIGAYFPASWQFANSLWSGSYISPLNGNYYGLIRGCAPGNPCNMYFYRFPNYASTGGVANPIFVWQQLSIASPAYRGFGADESNVGHPITYSILFNGALREINFGSGVLGGASPDPPQTNLLGAYAYDETPPPNTKLYFFSTLPSFPDVLCLLTVASGDQTCYSITYPGASRPASIVYYNQASPGFTTSPLSTGPLTTAPLTSNGLTTNGLTTGSISTGSISTGSISTGSISTAAVSTGEVTTDAITSAELTTVDISTGEITTSLVTTGIEPTTAISIPSEEVVTSFTSAVAIAVPTILMVVVVIAIAIAYTLPYANSMATMSEGRYRRRY